MVYAINFFFLRDFIFKKTLFEKLQYLKQEQKNLSRKRKFPQGFFFFAINYICIFIDSVPHLLNNNISMLKQKSLPLTKYFQQ